MVAARWYYNWGKIPVILVSGGVYVTCYWQSTVCGTRSNEILAWRWVRWWS